jgi:hypothetical protein
MTYSVIIDVTAPVDLYDVTPPAELLRRTGGQVDGLLVHLCRPVDGGFQVIEVWTTENDYRRATQDLIEPTLNAERSVAGPIEDASRRGVRAARSGASRQWHPHLSAGALP